MAYRPKDLKDRLLHRIKIVEGQMGKVRQMVESDRYCIDVIHQSQAIRQALREIDNLMLENHLKHCVADALRAGRRDDAIREVMNVFHKSQ